MPVKANNKNKRKGEDKKIEKEEDISEKRKLDDDNKDTTSLSPPSKVAKVDEVEITPEATTIPSVSTSSCKKNWVIGSAKPRVSENIIPNIKITDPLKPDSNWHDMDDLYYYYPTGCNLKSPIVYAFDFDSTLVDFKSDKISFPHVIDKLKELNDKGHSVVIISNQAGVPAGKMTINQMEKRFETFLKLIPFSIPVLACISKHSIFRKPCVGMFQFYCNYIHSDVVVEIDKSFYCGDAAGRDAFGSRKKDFSPGDYLFSQNIGCNFITPDAFFEDSKNKIDIDPGMWHNKITDPITFDDSSIVLPDIKLSDKQEMIVLVGPPASGKSTIVNIFKDYERINQDTLKTKPKCISTCKSAISSGKSVIIDNTNKDVANRAEWIKIAKASNIPVRCVDMIRSLELSFHLNQFRAVDPYGVENRHVPMVALRTFFKGYTKPELSEGFSEIIKAPFKPSGFKNEGQKQLFYSWLTSEFK